MGHADRLTILHLLTSYAIGGGEQVALNLAGGQISHGHEVHVASLSPGPDGPHRESFARAGVRSHRIHRWGPTFDPTLVARLAHLMTRLDVSIVHSHNPLPLIYGGPAARLARRTLVHTKHGFNQATGRRTWLRRLAGSIPDAMVAVSAQTRDDALAQRDCPVDKLVVIDNGIDLSGYHRAPETREAVRSELGIPTEAWVVGTVGRMSKVKNQSLLVRAAGPLLGPANHLVLVGDGDERSAVEREVERLEHPESVHLLGLRRDVPRLLQGLDVFALPSKSEGLPMVLPEAMASELPVVSTRVGGIADVVAHGKTGLLVPEGDEAELRAMLEKLRADPVLARRMGQQGRADALDRYSAERMVKEYESLYRRLLDERKHSGSLGGKGA